MSQILIGQKGIEIKKSINGQIYISKICKLKFLTKEGLSIVNWGLNTKKKDLNSLRRKIFRADKTAEYPWRNQQTLIGCLGQNMFWTYAYDYKRVQYICFK